MLKGSSARLIYILLAALSGAAGIGYEVLYNRALTSALGHTFSVNASILVSFLSGIAIGSIIAHKFLRYLWLVEIGLGLYTISFFSLISTSGSYGGARFLYVFSTTHTSALAGACLLTFIPAILVGMSLPMFSRYIKEHFHGHPFRMVYAIYNLGAIGGVLLVEFLLLRIMPVSRAAFFMGSLNLIVGLAILIISRKAVLEELDISWRKVFPVPLLISLFILSLSSSVFQLFFLKTVYYTTGRFNSNFTLTLATVFFYIAMGTALIQKKPGLAQWVFPGAIVSIALWFAAQPVMLYGVAILNSIEIKLSLPYHTAWILSPVWLGFPLLFFGASVPACIKSQDAVSRDSGILLLISGIGNAAGYLLFALVLHPNLEIKRVLAVGIVLSIFSLIFFPGISKRVKSAVIFASVFFICIGLFTWNQGLYFLGLEGYRSYSVIRKNHRMTTKVEEFPSRDQTFALRHYFSPKKKNSERMKYFIDGYVSLDLPSEESIAGSVAAMYARERNDLLVIGFGTGMSAGAASVFFRRVDLVELNPEVIRLQDRFAEINFNVHRLPKTRIFQEDGFQYLIKTKKKYDMIISTVTAPYFPASIKMYTDEFYSLVSRHLNAGGIFSLWFDVRLDPYAIPIYLKTLNRHFPRCAMNYIYEGYYVLACSDQPLKADPGVFDTGYLPLEEYEKVVGKEIKKRLKNKALIPNIMEPRYLEILGVREDTPVNRLDWPLLEYFHPEEAIKYHLSFMTELLPLIDFGYSLADGRSMAREEFDERCRSLEEWFEEAVPECKKQFEKRFLSD